MGQSMADRLRDAMGCEYTSIAAYNVIDINTLIGYLLTVKERYGEVPVYMDTGAQVIKPHGAYLMRANQAEKKDDTPDVAIVIG